MKYIFSRQMKDYINNEIFVCFYLQISAPKDITEDELLKLIEQNETENAAFHYRVPMSLGEPHSELDNCKYFLFY